jgi:hypothetical protein
VSVKRSEQRDLHRALERRILAGGRKADIVGQAAADGQDWQTYARLVALIPTPASRRRWRWLNRGLVALVAATTAAWLAGLTAVESGVWLAVALVCPLFLASTLWGLAHYRGREYFAASGIAVVGLSVWLYTIAWRSPGLAPPGLIAGEAVLCGLVIVVALLTVHLLLPATTIWTDVRPKTDSDGQLTFEE